jgi:hypothetical protein
MSLSVECCFSHLALYKSNSCFLLKSLHLPKWEIKQTIYHALGEHLNHYITNAVFQKRVTGVGQGHPEEDLQEGRGKDTDQDLYHPG